jgi:hypothetical protein
MIDETKGRIQTRIKESIDWKSLKDKEIMTETIARILQLQTPNFINTPQSRGIITKQLITDFKEHPQTNELPIDQLLTSGCVQYTVGMSQVAIKMDFNYGSKSLKSINDTCNRRFIVQSYPPT